MKTLREFLDEQISGQMIQAVLSGSREADVPSKVKIRPVMLKGELCYQASALQGQKVFHRNYGRGDVLAYLENCLAGQYSQLQIQGRSLDGSVLVSRKGKVTMKTKARSEKRQAAMLAHNRVRNYILKEGVPIPFLVDLGVMNSQGRVLSAKYDKFRQINRFLEYIEDILPALPQGREITILDFGCGKSYLTFAMYYYFRELKGRPVRITGLDLKEDVIADCARLAEKYGYDSLSFCQGDIAGYEGVHSADMVVTLHACDTATDYALARAVEWGAQVILSVPCCQHELNRQIQNDVLEPLLRYGILKERMAALVTDGIRAGLLETKGYEVQLLEFIDMEHTPKNLLIRAVKTGKERQPDRIRRVMEELHVRPTLERLLCQGEREPAHRGE